MRLFVKLKGILGYCQSKGCWNKSDFDVDIPSIKVKRHLCETHTKKLADSGTLKSITYQKTIDLD
jgi:hypothetical protein